MKGELDKIERLKDRHKAIIIDMMPKNDDELKMILSNEVVTISDDDKKKIISIVKKFA
jgi:DNA-directed RNA polymerase subunit F